MMAVPGAEDFARRLDRLDPALLAETSQTTEGDRRSLLRVQAAVRAARPAYRYGEIGSHLGGSLVPHLLDPACAAIVSIDPRPLSQPDERGRDFTYQDNSTARMIEDLRPRVGEAALGKLRTFDLDARDVPAGPDTTGLDLVLIDGEHTDTAAFSDFVSMLPLLAPDAVVAWHDADLVIDALQNAERLLEHRGIPFRTVLLPDVVGAIGLGTAAGLVERALAPFALERAAFTRAARAHIHRSIVEAAIERGEALPPAAAAAPGDPTLREALHRAEAERDTLRAERDALARERDRLRGIERSTVWRASAPLRRVAARLLGRGG